MAEDSNISDVLRNTWMMSDGSEGKPTGNDLDLDLTHVTDECPENDVTLAGTAGYTPEDSFGQATSIPTPTNNVMGMFNVLPQHYASQPNPFHDSSEFLVPRRTVSVQQPTFTGSAIFLNSEKEPISCHSQPQFLRGNLEAGSNAKSHQGPLNSAVAEKLREKLTARMRQQNECSSETPPLQMQQQQQFGRHTSFRPQNEFGDRKPLREGLKTEAKPLSYEQETALAAAGEDGSGEDELDVVEDGELRSSSNEMEEVEDEEEEEAAVARVKVERTIGGGGSGRLAASPPAATAGSLHRQQQQQQRPSPQQQSPALHAQSPVASPSRQQQQPQSQQPQNVGGVTLEELLQQPTTNTTTTSAQAMQFYASMHQQPPPQRETPPFSQSYGRPDEEPRQIMNLDMPPAQASYSGSHLYPPMSTGNTMYELQQAPPQHQQQHRARQEMSSLYAPPMGHPQAAYYGVPPQPPQPHHMHHQPPPMMPPMQQPYYPSQSPLAGHGVPPTHHPMTTSSTPPVVNFDVLRPNGNGQIFNFAKRNPRSRKTHDVGAVNSPSRYSSGDADGAGSGSAAPAPFPDMSDFPLLDVAPTKTKESGRKQCRPHLCEQSRMLIARVGHFNREFSKRLSPRHPLHGSQMSKADQWTSAQMGISVATVRKCMDMAAESETFIRCSDKNLVNLTPVEKEEREARLQKLAEAFEDEKALGAGTLGLNTSMDSNSGIPNVYDSPSHQLEPTMAKNDKNSADDDASSAEVPIVATINRNSSDPPTTAPAACPTQTVQTKEVVVKEEHERKKGRPPKRALKKEESVDDRSEKDKEHVDEAAPVDAQPPPADVDESASSEDQSSRSSTATPSLGKEQKTPKKKSTGRKRANLNNADSEFEVKRSRAATSSASAASVAVEADDADSHKMTTRSTRSRH